MGDANGHPFSEAIRERAPAWMQPGTQAPGVLAQPFPQLCDHGPAHQTLRAQLLLHEMQGETSSEKAPGRPPTELSRPVVSAVAPLSPE